MFVAIKLDSPSSMMLTTTPCPVTLFLQTGIKFMSVASVNSPCANYTHTDTYIHNIIKMLASQKSIISFFLLFSKSAWWHGDILTEPWSVYSLADTVNIL